MLDAENPKIRLIIEQPEVVPAMGVADFADLLSRTGGGDQAEWLQRKSRRLSTYGRDRFQDALSEAKSLLRLIPPQQRLRLAGSALSAGALGESELSSVALIACLDEGDRRALAYKRSYEYKQMLAELICLPNRRLTRYFLRLPGAVPEESAELSLFALALERELWEDCAVCLVGPPNTPTRLCLKNPWLSGIRTPVTEYGFSQIAEFLGVSDRFRGYDCGRLAVFEFLAKRKRVL